MITFHKGVSMKTADVRQRAGAIAMALSVTFAIIWALSSYAYERPAESGLAQTAVKLVAKQTCS